MNDSNTGGAAFPIRDGNHATMGMTLRDYFAAKAMQSLILDGHYQKMSRDSVIDMNELYEGMAAESYDIADAMLKVRSDI